MIVEGQMHGGIAQGSGPRSSRSSSTTRTAASSSTAPWWTTSCRRPPTCRCSSSDHPETPSPVTPFGIGGSARAGRSRRRGDRERASATRWRRSESRSTGSRHARVVWRASCRGASSGEVRGVLHRRRPAGRRVGVPRGRRPDRAVRPRRAVGRDARTRPVQGTRHPEGRLRVGDVRDGDQIESKDPLRSLVLVSVGKSVKGAIGDLRSRDRVDFEAAPEGGTRVPLTSEVAIGGMLGALGQKAIAAKSGKSPRVRAGAPG